MKRHSDALGIIDPGACNPRAVVRSLVAAIEEAASEDPSTAAIASDPACRLITYQLATIMGIGSGMEYDDFQKCQTECAFRAHPIPAVSTEE